MCCVPPTMGSLCGSKSGFRGASDWCPSKSGVPAGGHPGRELRGAESAGSGSGLPDPGPSSKLPTQTIACDRALAL